MKQLPFELSRREAWNRFEAQLKLVETSPIGRSKFVSAPDEFTVAYQEIGRDLALAKHRGYSIGLTDYLNELVIRGHNAIYIHRTGWLKSALRFIAAGFPARVRAARAYVIVALVTALTPVVGISILISQSPEYIFSLMSAEDVADFESMYSQAQDRDESARDAGTQLTMFAFYIENNVSIAFRCFAGGILFGVGSLFFLIWNSLVISGVVTWLTVNGYGDTILPFIAGHSSFELTAIVLSAAAGLMIGHAIVAPGRETRGASLRRAARHAVEIVIGVAIMLVIAALIEAFWSPASFVSASVKYVVGAVLWMLVISYFLLAGRRGNREASV